jgi:hypothetical protein
VNILEQGYVSPNAGNQPYSGIVEKKTEEFRRFERLLKRLGGVSKADLDEQDAKERSRATHTEAPGKDESEAPDDASSEEAEEEPPA